MSLKTLTVADLVFGIKSNLEERFRQVLVEGEVSNVSRTVAGHIYFTLSDERACVSCALFRADALRNSMVVRKMKDGDHILVAGSIGVYAKRGVFQVVAKRLSPAGKGNLALQFELLKEKFSKLGYFDSHIKKSVPKFPKRVAIITAPYGAALQDFLKVMKRRSLWHDIVIVPAIVQGEESPASVSRALRQAAQLKGVEVVVLTRGGGAMEDLWSFNHESVVEEIFKCPLPVISAIGHEVDTTLADLVADLRLETPSAAAEYLSQPHTEIQRRVKGLGQNLKSLLYHHQHLVQKRLQRINPANLARGLEMKLNELRHRLLKIDLVKNRELYLGLNEKELIMSDLLEKGRRALERSFQERQGRVEMSSKMLRSLDPQNVVKRGYCYVENSEGRVIANFSEYDKLEKEERLIINFKDGKGKAKKADT